MKRNALLLVLLASTVSAETRYRLPPKVVVDILDAAPTPQAVVSPRGDALALVAVEANPPIALLAQPFLRLAGLRITPATRARQRTLRHTGIEIVKTDGSGSVRVALPAGATIGMPGWSPDGRRLAFTRDREDGVELWVADAQSGTARALSRVRVNDVLGPAFAWVGDGSRLLVRMVPDGTGAPPAEPKVPLGPVVDEVAGKRSQVATFQDLLQDEHDEDLFEHYGRTQLAVVDAATGTPTPVGEPGLYSSASFSPDGRFLLVTRLQRPFSFRVPYQSFTRSVQVWDAAGKRVATMAELKVSDEVPRQGVPTGPRAMAWQPLRDAALVWVEALDGGDPIRPATHRDRLMTQAAPFSGAPLEVLRLKHRFAGVDWTARRNQGLLSEFDRARRWSTTHLVNLDAPETDRVVFDRSRNDDYSDPGQPVTETRANGHETLIQDGDTVYLAGDGASPDGDRPFLDALDLNTMQKRRLFGSRPDRLERFLGFAPGSRTGLLVRSESPSEPPNFFLVDTRADTRKQLTELPDPAPQLRQVTKQLIKYQRKDGVQLSGTLYLPAGHTPGTRLPAMVWAYPLEYSDADTAGQVRSTPTAFTRLAGPSPVFLVTQGFAVLMDATMPVVGDPETVNNGYVEQISENARAAIAKLDEMGVADPKRVVIGGHSYGAFMTANLLAHTDLFVAGIARSGAYNRTLTPFGFQTERRSFWEAKDVYMGMSPFTFADKIKRPLLLIHGQADNNSGTFPIQSERLFAAIRGNGGTARLVLLPHEAHGYRARESVLDTLAEMIEWAARWAKPGP